MGISCDISLKNKQTATTKAKHMTFKVILFWGTSNLVVLYPKSTTTWKYFLLGIWTMLSEQLHVYESITLSY